MPRYRMKPKVGPHKHNDGAWYHPGDVLECEPEEVRGAINKFDLLTEGETTPKPKRTRTTPPEPPEEDTDSDAGPEPGEGEMEDEVGLVLQSTEDGLYDVVNPETGDKINEEPLSKKDAEKLLRGT